MSLARTAFYDAETQTLWIARRFFATKTRVPRDEVRQWMKMLKEGGTTDDGRPVSAINYLFIDEATAAYNYQTLAFAGLGVYYKEGGNHIPYIPDEDEEVRVDVRADLGLLPSAGEEGDAS